MSGTQPGVRAAARADDAFGADLYQTIAPQGNTVFSPASVAAALRMTLIGARGETAAEIARALHLEPATASEGVWPLSTLLAEPADSERRLAFRAPNTMWVQSGMPLEHAFLAAIADVAAAAVHDADFVHESEKARQRYNHRRAAVRLRRPAPGLHRRGRERHRGRCGNGRDHEDAVDAGASAARGHRGPAIPFRD